MRQDIERLPEILAISDRHETPIRVIT